LFVAIWTVSAANVVFAVAIPKGTTTLQSSALKKVGSVQCGLLKSKWIVGTIYGTKSFISHSKQNTNFSSDAKKAKGSKRTKLLKTAAAWKTKASKYQYVCSSLNVSSPSTTTPETSSPGVSTPVVTTTSVAPTAAVQTLLKFNMVRAVGLTLKSNVSSSSVRKTSTGSNLQAVDAAGNTSDAVSSGTASIKNFLIAPNDKLYVVFNSKTTIGSVSCLLAEVAKATGDPKCIDSDLSSISWPSSGSYEFDPIQFDENGSIYYVGTDSTEKSVLRRFKDGTSTSLVTDNVSSLRFLVLPDGRVVLGGTTTSTGAKWTRMVTTSGGLQTLVSGALPEFLSRFPDGNVYMGMWGGDNFGVKRFFNDRSAMDPKYWIAGNMNGPQSAFYNVADFEGTPQFIEGLRGYYGAKVKQIVSTSDGKVFCITGTTPTLVQYYPNVLKPSTLVTTVNVLQRVLSYIILS
jgi:hypothetical protein